MKTLRVLMAAIFLSAMFAFSHLGLSYAQEEHSEEDIQMLWDAAMALKVTNPDLSEKLSEYADREAEETEATEATDETDEEAGEE